MDEEPELRWLRERVRSLGVGAQVEFAGSISSR